MMFLGMSDLQIYQSHPERDGNRGYYAAGWRWGRHASGHYWFLGSGWQKRTEELFALAGEVSRKLGEQQKTEGKK